VKKGFLHEAKVEAPKDADRFVLEEAQGLLDKVDELHAEDCEETNPFRAKYQARELKQLAACEWRGTTSSFEEVRVATSLRAEYMLGVNFYDCEETSSGEKTLVGAVERMRASPTFSRVALMDALNHLGMIWCGRSEYSRAREYLEQSLSLHGTGEERLAGAVDSPEGRQLTTTLFLMAQVHQHSGEAAQAAGLCQLTLDRQARGGLPAGRDEWVKNAIQLSGFFLSSGRSLSAARCLAAAEEVSSGGEVTSDSRAHLHWGWAKLHLCRLSDGRDAITGNQSSPPDPGPEAHFKMAGIQQHLPPHLSDTVRGCGVRDYDSALAVAKRAISHVTKVRGVLTLDEAASDNVAAAQDLSRVFAHLAALAPLDDDKTKLHKRRIDLLEPLVEQLNIAAFDWLCKETWVEVAEAYRDMFDIKVTQVEAGLKKVTQEKLVALADGSIKAYKRFLGLFEAPANDPDAKHETWPKGLPNPQGIKEMRFRRWYLVARFSLARVISRKPSADLLGRKAYLTQAIDEYKTIVALCERLPFDKAGKERFDDELEICKEMVVLLPTKIARLHTLNPGKSGTG